MPATIGHYEITGRLGAGGMGEVYRATDTQLQREVALKILPEEFAADSQRMARFEREAQILASLSHPNIGAIYGIEEAGSTRALVLELIEGPTLDERLAQGPMPAPEAVAVALQIAAALEAAHQKGVVHRDLKPANIKVSDEGQVKVLDFGLAKASEPEGDPSSPALTQSPTLTMAATEAGVILGTAAYMSPEQARGRPVDQRADIWAFGAVFYEMLTGVQPFAGDTLTDTLAAVVTREPELSAAPPAWRTLIRRCLHKDPTLRLQHIGDARIELLEGGSPAQEQPASRQAGFPFGAAAVALAAGLLLGAGAMSIWSTEPAAPATGPLAFSIRTPQPATTVAVSPDGRTIAFGAGDELWVRRGEDMALRSVARTEANHAPFFSPDSRWLGFFSDGWIRRIAVAGGDAVQVVAVGESPGATWGPDGTIVFTPSFTSPLLAVSSDGGSSRPVTRLDREAGEFGHWWPQFLPDGRRVLFTIWTEAGTLNRAVMAVADVASGEVERIGEGALPRYLDSGHLMFIRTGSYVVAPFDAAAARLVGEARPVGLPIRREDPVGEARRRYAVSGTGTLVYLAGESNITPGTLVWRDRSGTFTDLPFEKAAFEDFQLSPSGDELVAAVTQKGEVDLWLYDLSRGITERLTRQGNNFNAHWSAAGRSLAYTTSNGGSFNVRRTDLDGDREPVTVLSDPLDFSVQAWSPAGETLLLQHYHPERGVDVFSVPTAGGEAVPILAGDYDEVPGDFSPRGDWFVYTSTQSGTREVYVRRTDGSGSPIRLSTNGGNDPRWRADNEIFFVSRGGMVAVTVREAGGRLQPEPPQELFSMEGFVDQQSWDVTGDGRRFLLVRKDETYPADEIRVVVNWFEELRQAGN